VRTDKAAALLEAAERRAVGIEPLSRTWGVVRAADAWQVARARDDRRRACGLRQTGYKLGWTSEAMRAALGISAPNHGSLWDYMAVADVLDLSALIHPKAEPEFAFRAGSVLAGPDVTADDVMRAGDWAVALEIVDPRWTSYDVSWADNTADGSSAARYVVGAWSLPDSPPAGWSLTLSIDGQERSGFGEAAMGSPALAVAFLVQALHEAGERLSPGMVVLTGGITAPVDVTEGMRLRVESPELGSCEVVCRRGEVAG
jgi:2-keto-4-pentenoate hydratase